MQVRCPHCHNRLELVDDAPLEDIVCTSCGSSFNLVDRERWTTIDYEANKKIAHFELIEQLGVGAFGSVWRARDTQLDREVAIKIPRREQLDPGEAERFIREARAAAQLRHPSIVQVHEVGRDGDQLYIVSDLVRGATLADWLTAHRLSPRESAELCLTLAEALHHAHQCGVVHRDLKPGNVMLDMEGKPYVLDFGLAKRDAGEITMTLDGRVLGTPAYMSPEQARGEAHDADARSDVYSLGVILFQLLTGELPFRGNSRMLLVQIQNEEPPTPRKLNAAVPRDLETITLKCLEKSPSRRYQTAQGLAEEFRRHLEGRPIHARPISRIERVWRWSLRQPLAAGLTAAVFATLLGGASISTYFAVRANEKAREANENAQREAEERKKAVVQKDRADREADAAWANLYFAHMILNQFDYGNREVSRIRDRLELYRWPAGGRRDVRGWEWYYQERLLQRELQTFKGHTREIVSAVFSPDGARLASGGTDETVKLWDAATGRELRTLKGHTSYVTCVAFSPDGMRLASAGSFDGVKLWDAATGQELLTLKGRNGVAFSPDGTNVACGGANSTVNLWDAAAGRLLRIFKGHTDEVIGVAFSPDGKRLASASSDKTVKLWDTATGQTLHTFTGHPSILWTVAFSPDGARVASAGYETVKLWDATTGDELRTLKGDNVTFSPDGVLMAAGRENTLTLWDVATGQELRTFRTHPGSINTVAFSPDGLRVVSAGDLTVRLWSTMADQDLRSLQGHTESVTSVAFSPDGATAASASSDSMVKLWDTATGQELRTLKGHANRVNSVAFSPDGTRVASASDDAIVRLWDTATGQEVRTFKGPSPDTKVAFSQDGAQLVAAGALWDTETGRQLRVLEYARVVLSRDLARVASAASGGDGILALWDTATSQPRRTLKGHTAAVTCVTFDPDGTRVASTSWDTTVKLWDTATGQELRTLKGHTDAVMSVAFSPDGKRLASASWDEMVKLWDTATGQELRTLKGPANRVNSVAWSPDGMRVASVSGNTVNLWDGRPLTIQVKAELNVVALLEMLFARPLPQAAVSDAIRRDKAIDEATRQQALKLAELYKEEKDPQKYHDAAWNVIRHPYSNLFVLQFALAQTRAAVERAPDNATYRMGLGVAQLRLGKFEKERCPEALATLQECDQTQPTTLAFLAMTQHRLDQKDEAKATLVKLRDVMKAPQWASDQQAQAFLREAEQLIEGESTKP